jgi:hypothetical protein
LYQYIESIAQEVREDNIVIYRFFPHGSKKVEDLQLLHKIKYWEFMELPHIICNDQEPLDYNYYLIDNKLPRDYEMLYKKYNLNSPIDLNLRITLTNIYDQTILLHSEKRSKNVDLYRDNYWIPVYYWAHAIIARDWFRYAEHVVQKKNVGHRFLVYNRAWSGTREYRLGFAERLIRLGLVDHTLMRVSPVDSTIDKHYDLHTFKHPEWRPHNVIENYFPLCEADSHYSADFNQTDYESTDIEIVLETLFDDLRLHLTEKTLRPIAMGQPFVLAGTYGSLAYLRSYGFKTFSDCWDESYDMMSDSVDRMNKITEVMGDIASMLPAKREEMLARAGVIADYNKQHFFSNEFFNQVVNELKANLDSAFNELEATNTSKLFFNWRKKISKLQELKEKITNVDRRALIKSLSKARSYYVRSLSKD